MTDLFEALDKAAAVMLEKATQSDRLDTMATVFQTVAKYAESRAKAAPPPEVKKAGNQFDKLRAQFHGDTPRKRGASLRLAATDGEA